MYFNCVLNVNTLAVQFGRRIVPDCCHDNSITESLVSDLKLQQFLTSIDFAISVTL